jgi:Na+-translocating ferredoxin:NAD+ oxidoreductase RnfG subunit
MLKKILAVIAALGSTLSAVFFVLFRQAKEEQKETEQKNKDLINNMDALQYSEHIQNEVKKQNEELVEKAHSDNTLDSFNALNELLSK